MEASSSGRMNDWTKVKESELVRREIRPVSTTQNKPNGDGTFALTVLYENLFLLQKQKSSKEKDKETNVFMK